MIYVGCHQTKDINDDYFGSGRYIESAIKRYGLVNFVKEILFVFEDKQSMFEKEREIVNEAFINNPNTYNLVLGGKSGWFNNSNGAVEANTKSQLKIAWLKEFDKEWNDERKIIYANTAKKIAKIKKENGFVPKPPMKPGDKHRPETILKIKQLIVGKQKGKNNSQFGTCWVYNENGSIKIKVDQLEKYLQLGFTKGRKMK